MKTFRFFAFLFLLVVGSGFRVSAQETKVRWFGTRPSPSPRRRAKCC